MKRIICHWTAGNHRASALELGRYHFIVEGDGVVVAGKFRPEDNLNPQPGRYAAHTLNCNTGSIGVSMAAMLNAQERPFRTGDAPITDRQLQAFVALVAELAARYRISITRQTILTHAEVQPTLGIKQRQKWDITWLPGMAAPADPVFVGDKLRRMIYEAGRKPSFLSTLLAKIGVKK